MSAREREREAARQAFYAALDAQRPAGAPTWVQRPVK